jgi:hypothetical protein
MACLPTEYDIMEVYLISYMISYMISYFISYDIAHTDIAYNLFQRLVENVALKAK